VRVLLIHNEYRCFGGEQAVVQDIQRVLEANGHETQPFFQTSAGIASFPQKANAFGRGIYNPSSRIAIRRLIAKLRPHVANVHNVFPLISPSVLPELRAQGIPTLMTVHNYRLVCPNGLHLWKDRLCEQCCGGHEYWCAVRNCTGELFKSVGYAFRNYVARRARFFSDNVTLYAPLTAFSKNRLIDAGISEERIAVIPNMVHPGDVPSPNNNGSVVGCVGRVSPEKGIPCLAAAAQHCPSISFQVAGDYSAQPEILSSAPKNMSFLGHLNKEALDEFYTLVKILAFPSICFEGFPGVLLEAMVRGIPVVCSRIGGLPEIVEDGVTGLLFEPGNADELAQKIQFLIDRPSQCREMGERGREKVLREYSPERYYERLMTAFDKALALGPGGALQ